MQISRSARFYRERVGLMRTRRYPVPRLCPALNIVHTTPIAPESVSPALILSVEGHSPDHHGTTHVWPHGKDGEPWPLQPT